MLVGKEILCCLAKRHTEQALFDYEENSGIT
jgi:hypothetical protein